MATKVEFEAQKMKKWVEIEWYIEGQYVGGYMRVISKEDLRDGIVLTRVMLAVEVPSSVDNLQIEMIRRHYTSLRTKNERLEECYAVSFYVSAMGYAQLMIIPRELDVTSDEDDKRQLIEVVGLKAFLSGHSDSVLNY